MMKKFVKLVALASVLALVKAGNLVIQPCSTDTVSLATEVGLSSPSFADGEERPVLKKGLPYELVLTFKSSAPADKLQTKVAALIAGVEAPWNGVSPNTCNFLTEGSCPFEAGQTYTYTNRITVPKNSPTIALTILWRVKFPDSSNEICLELPAKIEN